MSSINCSYHAKQEQQSCSYHVLISNNSGQACIAQVSERLAPLGPFMTPCAPLKTPRTSLQYGIQEFKKSSQSGSLNSFSVNFSSFDKKLRKNQFGTPRKVKTCKKVSRYLTAFLLRFSDHILRTQSR